MLIIRLVPHREENIRDLLALRGISEFNKLFLQFASAKSLRCKVPKSEYAMRCTSGTILFGATIWLQVDIDYISDNLHQREFNLSVYEEAKIAPTILCVFGKRWKNHRIVMH